MERDDPEMLEKDRPTRELPESEEPRVDAGEVRGERTGDRLHPYVANRETDGRPTVHADE